MQPSFELFDHTADIGIRVRAATLAGLIVPAGEALYAVIGDLVVEGRPQSRGVVLAGPDAPTLLRDYLAELLLAFEQGQHKVTTARVNVFDTGRLHVDIETKQVDGRRCVYHREVKAVTYHLLDIQTIRGGYEASVILDI